MFLVVYRTMIIYIRKFLGG